jgi:hypothetical protein
VAFFGYSLGGRNGPGFLALPVIRRIRSEFSSEGEYTFLEDKFTTVCVQGNQLQPHIKEIFSCTFVHELLVLECGGMLPTCSPEDEEMNTYGKPSIMGTKLRMGFRFFEEKHPKTVFESKNRFC